MKNHSISNAEIFLLVVVIVLGRGDESLARLLSRGT